MSFQSLTSPIAGLSDAERASLMELIPVAEDLYIHGDEKAGPALDWMRGLLEANP